MRNENMETPTRELKFNFSSEKVQDTKPDKINFADKRENDKYFQLSQKKDKDGKSVDGKAFPKFEKINLKDKSREKTETKNETKKNSLKDKDVAEKSIDSKESKDKTADDKKEIKNPQEKAKSEDKTVDKDIDTKDEKMPERAKAPGKNTELYRMFDKKEEKQDIKKDTEKERPNQKNTEKKRPKKEERGDDLAEQAKDSAFALERDLRDLALGQIYKIPGANVDYDEINKMAKNNIRDVGELANESLQNDGFTGSIEEVKAAMSGYVNEGKPDINEIVKMSKNATMNVMAHAFTEVVKESCMMDTDRISKIHDACNFDSRGYENIFDRIRCFDRQADMAFDDFELETGLEREF